MRKFYWLTSFDLSGVYRAKVEARLHDARKRVAELQAQSPEGKSRPDTKRTNALLGFFG